MSAVAEPLPKVQDILDDPAASDWLKSALINALARDPVDALNDALVLAQVLDDRLREEFALD